MWQQPGATPAASESMQPHTVPGLPQLQLQGLNNSDLLAVIQLQLLELLLLLCRTSRVLWSVMAQTRCCCAAAGVLLPTVNVVVDAPPVFPGLGIVRHTSLCHGSQRCSRDVLQAERVRNSI